MNFIDTHTHLDGEEFALDRDEVVARAKAAGVSKMFIPAINLPSVDTVLAACARYPGVAYPMLGLHPEDVKADWRDVLSQMKARLDTPEHPFIAIGEVGLDYYWSREFEQEQLEALEEQVRWSVETRLPLMLHCRKAQNEMVGLLRDNFVLGIGGVLTFKKSHLPEVLPAAVPLERIVIETDSPYMAPVPMRGKRNESAFALYVLKRLAECYGVSEDEVAATTNANAVRVFGIGA